MRSSIEGKVVLVTGGATGMGKATCKLFAEYGATVITCTAHNVSGAEQTVNEIREKGGNAEFFKCDVSNENDVKTMIDEIVRHYGKLDIAVNNAGVGPDGVRMPFAPLADISTDDMNKTIDTNLKGMFFLLKYEILQMKKQGGGAIVSIASNAGLRPSPAFSVYSATKAATVFINQSAAIEYGPDKIRINVVCPGPTEGTTLIDNSYVADPGMKEHVPNIFPLRKMGQAEDVAQAVLWLASDLASHVTGTTLSVDGGMALV